MKKGKRILAILGVIFLAGLYLLTLIFAITDNSNSMNFFAASVFATIVIPVLIWAYTFIYKLVTKHDDTGSEEE